MVRVSRRQFVIFTGGALAAAVVAACGEGRTSGGQEVSPAPSPTPVTQPSPTASPTTGASRIPHPDGPDELVLRIERTGGFVPQFHAVTELPLFSLFGDGSVVTLGPQIMIYPPPALPNVLVTKLTEEGVQAILQAAEEAGLLAGDRSYELGTIADATTTVFTVNARGKTSVVRVYALLEADPNDPGIPEDERADRERLRAFYERALSFPAWLPERAIAVPERPYRVERLQLVVVPVDSRTEPQAPDVQPGELDWPLATPLEQFGDPHPNLWPEARCGVVEQAELAVVLEAMAQANTLTRWRSAGALYHVYPRPLLPDETPCAW